MYKSSAKKRPLKTLERVLSKAGVGSRTEARAWVSEGRVKVNGKVARNPDQWIDMQRDRVRFDDRPLETRERVHVLLYKPTGYLTTYKAVSYTHLRAHETPEHLVCRLLL